MFEDFQAQVQPVLGALHNNPLGSYYIAVIAMLWPMIRIFRRAGFSALPVAWLSLPFLGIFAAFGFLVFRPWPVLPVRIRKERVKS